MFTARAEIDRTRGLLALPKKKARSKRQKKLKKRFELPEMLEVLGSKVSAYCDYAGVPEKARRGMAIRISSFSVLICGVSLVFHSPLILAFIFLPLLFEYIALKKKITARAKSFERDYPALLLSLASSVRTGLDPLFALKESYKLFSEGSVISEEIKSFRTKIDRGMPEEKALKNFAITVKHPDIDLFRTAMILARKEGSSLSQCLQRLAKVTRQRQSFRRKVRVAVAMQKLSATGIAIATVIIGIIQFNANPEGFKEAVNHPVGSKLLSLGVVLIVCGLLWMRRMASSKALD